MYSLIGYFNKGWPDTVGGARATTESREKVIEKFYTSILNATVQDSLRNFLMTYDHEDRNCFEQMIDFCRKAEALDPTKKPKTKRVQECQLCFGMDHATADCRKPAKKLAKVDQTCTEDPNGTLNVTEIKSMYQ